MKLLTEENKALLAKMDEEKNEKAKRSAKNNNDSN
jgi:hypothetical protein